MPLQPIRVSATQRPTPEIECSGSSTGHRDLTACRWNGMVRHIMTGEAHLPSTAMQHLLDALEERSRPLAELLRRALARGVTSTRYRIENELAHGGMGIVFRVTDLEVGRELALKRTREPLPLGGEANKRVVDPRYFARFLAEVRITGQLDHPGIVPLHELGLDEAGRLFFTMKLVTGETLAAILARLKRRAPEWDITRICQILLRVCDAVAFAHARAIVHRDLKPANIMVGTFGEVYVMDWGLARVLETAGPDDVSTADLRGNEVLDLDDSDESSGARTMEGEAVGTPSYMPPEQALGKLAEIDGRVDVYAIGAILYHALTGEAPYASDVLRGATGSGVVLRNVARQAPTPIAEFSREASPELIAICEKAMARARFERYPNVDALAADLRAYLDGRIVSALGSGPAVRLGKWILRHRRATFAALSIGVAATLAIGFGLRSMESVQRALALRDAASSATIKELEAKVAEFDRSSATLRSQLEAAMLEAERSTTDRKEWLVRKNELESAVSLAEEKASDLEARLHALEEHTREREARPLDTPPESRVDPGVKPVAPGLEEPLRARLETHARTIREIAALASRGAAFRDLLAADVAALESWLDDYAALTSRIEANRSRDPLLGVLDDELVSRSNRDLGALKDRLDWMHDTRLRIAGEVARVPTAGEDSWATVRDRLAPRLGADARKLAAESDLVPIGFDPDSDLPEFWLVESGNRPRRNPKTGRLDLDPEMGIVLVLVPGGTFEMGARRERRPGRGDQNVDPSADENESSTSGEPVSVTLDSFYFAKFELTNHQWRMLARRAPPSRLTPGSSVALGDKKRVETITLRNPVEGMTWEAANEILLDYGLTLPTEAQWEYAARGLAATRKRAKADGIPFWFDTRDKNLLTRFANILDGESGALYWSIANEDSKLTDPFAVHASVGSLEPNPLGLYDILGNVSEWCLDSRSALTANTRRSDGLLQGDLSGDRSKAIRGGDFRSPSHFARTTARRFLPRDEGFEFVGLRPARIILR